MFLNIQTECIFVLCTRSYIPAMKLKIFNFGKEQYAHVEQVAYSFDFIYRIFWLRACAV